MNGAPGLEEFIRGSGHRRPKSGSFVCLRDASREAGWEAHCLTRDSVGALPDWRVRGERLHPEPAPLLSELQLSLASIHIARKRCSLPESAVNRPMTREWMIPDTRPLERPLGDRCLGYLGAWQTALACFAGRLFVN